MLPNSPTPFALTPEMLKTLRARLNLSQRELAVKLGLSEKYGHMTICMWENQPDRCARVKGDHLKKIKALIKQAS